MVIVLAGAVLGGLVISTFGHYRPWLERWLQSAPELLPARMAAATAALALITVVPLLAFAFRLWTAGAKVRRHQRFPLEGERLVRDTPVLRGNAAVARGRALQGFAAAFALFAVALAVALWRLAAVLAGHAT